MCSHTPYLTHTPPQACTPARTATQTRIVACGIPPLGSCRGVCYLQILTVGSPGSPLKTRLRGEPRFRANRLIMQIGGACGLLCAAAISLAMIHAILQVAVMCRRVLMESRVFQSNKCLFFLVFHAPCCHSAALKLISSAVSHTIDVYHFVMVTPLFQEKKSSTKAEGGKHTSTLPGAFLTTTQLNVPS